MALDGETITGLHAAPTLTIDSTHPFGTVALTVTCATAEPVRIEAFESDGTPAAALDLQGPFTRRSVVLTGTSITTIAVRGPNHALILGEVCGTADYALHATAVGDRHYGPISAHDGVIEVSGRNIDLAELHSVTPYEVAGFEIVCGPLVTDVARHDEDVAHIAQELAHWSQPDYALEPYGSYRLSVTTRIEARPDSGTARNYTLTQFGYFQTEGPPGLADLTLPRNIAAPDELTLRDETGAPVGVRGTSTGRPVLKSPLNDLTPYVRQTMPATVPAAGGKPVLPRPVYRSYDVSITFNENSYLEVMYRRHQRELSLHVLTGSNTPARDAAGALIIDADSWTQAEALTLSGTDARWVSTVDAAGCVTMDVSTILRDGRLLSWAAERVLQPDTLHEAWLVPLLLHEDFTNGTARWTVRDEGTEGGPSAWAGASGPCLRQTSDIRGGGSPDPFDPVKPGTILLRADDVRMDAGHPDQSHQWADVRVCVHLQPHAGGMTGVVVRDRGAGDSVRFAMSTTGWILVRIAAGTYTALATGEHDLTAGRDYRVSVEAVGDGVRVRLDDSLLAAATIPAASGRVGLYCWHDPLARFTDLRVDDLRGNAPVLYRFGFVTSKYASFEDQLHAFRDEVRQMRSDADLEAVLNKVKIIGQSTPSPEEVSAFEALPSDSGPAPPENIELGITRLEGPAGPRGFLIQGPEPLDWTRTEFQVLRVNARPFPLTRPGDLKLTGVAFSSGVPNQESVTLLLRTASDLAGVDIERLDWVPDTSPGEWIFADEGGADPSFCALEPGGRNRTDLRLRVVLRNDDQRGDRRRVSSPGTGQRIPLLDGEPGRQARLPSARPPDGR